MLRFAPIAAAVALVAAAPGARAADDSPPRDEAAAQVLFDQARALQDQGRWEEACPKLAESDKLAPGVGTKFWLAKCYAQTGKLASAWTLFLDVASLTRGHGEIERERAAREEATKLEPRLCKLVVRVAAEGRASGLLVKRDGAPVGEPLWGVPVPIDAGSHVVEASAEGREPWQTNVTIVGEATTQTIEVPPLAPLSLPPPPPPSATAFAAPTASPTTTAPPPPPSDHRPIAYTLGAVGLAGLAAGTIFGLRSMSFHDDAQSHCDAHDACDAAGLDLRQQAISAGNVSTITFALGGVALAAGIVVFAMTPASPAAAKSGSARVQLVVGARGASLGGSW